MRRLALIAAASLGLGVAVIVDQPASFADHLYIKSGQKRPGGDLAHTILGPVKWQRIDLSGANLSDANLKRAELMWSNLNNANLSRAYLRGADLRGAKLNNANLSGAKLVNADLSGAKLNNANLSRADVKDANLSGADLRGSGLVMKGNTRFIATNLRGCPRYLPSGWVCENNSLIQR